MIISLFLHFYDNEEYFNWESMDYLNDSFSNFNSYTEDIFNEEPILEKKLNIFVKIIRIKYYWWNI